MCLQELQAAVLRFERAASGANFWPTAGTACVTRKCVMDSGQRKERKALYSHIVASLAAFFTTMASIARSTICLPAPRSSRHAVVVRAQAGRDTARRTVSAAASLAANSFGIPPNAEPKSWLQLLPWFAEDVQEQEQEW